MRMQEIVKTPTLSITMFVIVMAILITCVNILVTLLGGGYFTLETRIYASLIPVGYFFVIFGWARENAIYASKLLVVLLAFLVSSGPLMALWEASPTFPTIGICFLFLLFVGLPVASVIGWEAKMCNGRMISGAPIIRIARVARVAILPILTAASLGRLMYALL